MIKQDLFERLRCNYLRAWNGFYDTRRYGVMLISPNLILQLRLILRRAFEQQEEHSGSMEKMAQSEAKSTNDTPQLTTGLTVTAHRYLILSLHAFCFFRGLSTSRPQHRLTVQMTCGHPSLYAGYASARRRILLHLFGAASRRANDARDPSCTEIPTNAALVSITPPLQVKTGCTRLGSLCLIRGRFVRRHRVLHPESFRSEHEPSPGSSSAVISDDDDDDGCASSCASTQKVC